MSNVWTKGSRCGVDNCRSKYYRTIDGRRVCQYGHVNEGHIEINDEDDGGAEGFVVTRRLKELSQKRAASPGRHRGSKRVYGAHANEVYLKALQYLLRIQVRKLIDSKGFPEVFETVVKRVWIEYINTSFTFNRQADTSGSESEFSDTNSVSSAGSQRSFLTNAFERVPMPYDLISLMYYACRYLRLPVYLDSFIRWIMSAELPYFHSTYRLPKSIRERLNFGFTSYLNPYAPPAKGDICKGTIRLITAIEAPPLSLNYEPLLFKAVNELILPPEIYTATKKFIAQNKVSMEYKQQRELWTAQGHFPEVVLLASLVVVTKLYFAQPHYFGENVKIVDWTIWLQQLEKMDNPQGDSDRSMEKLLQSVFYDEKEHEKNLLKWNESTTEKYLDWVNNALVVPHLSEENDLPIPKRRLFNIFEMDESTPKDFEKASVAPAYHEILSNTSKSRTNKLTYADYFQIETVLVRHIIRTYGLEKKTFIDTLHSMGGTLFGFKANFAPGFWDVTQNRA